MARQETSYIVIHCSQTRPSQKDVDAKWIDRVHRSNGWLKIGYGTVILCLVGGAKEEDWKVEDDNFTGEQFDSLKKELTRLVKKYPDARIVGHRDLDDKKFCPSFDVRKYLLNEDIPNYKFQDGLTSEADLEELRDDGVI